MGNSLPTLAGQQFDPNSLLQSELTEYASVSQLGKGKFTKSFLARHSGRSAANATPFASEKAVVKLFQRRGDRSPDLTRRIAAAREQLAWLSRKLNLAAQPNLVPYQCFIESPRQDAAFLLRQHFQYNLYDRINTRPFLTYLEKLWIVFQLLRAVEQAHALGARHGDIKTENVMVTSWGWVLLTDFSACMKPTYIPEDHPADFYYFFEAGTRRRCYIAPERFVKERDLHAGGGPAVQAVPAASSVDAPSAAATSMFSPESDIAAAAALEATGRMRSVSGNNPLGGGTGPLPPGAALTVVVPAAGEAAGASSKPETPTVPSGAVGGGGAAGGGLQEGMDVFALGCVIAEVMLDGEPLFDLPSLLRYRVAAADFSPLGQEGVAEGFREADPSGAAAALVAHMIQRSAAKRASAAAYLRANTAAAAPESSRGGAPSSAPASAVFVVPGAGENGAGASPPARRMFPAFFRPVCDFFAALLRPEFATADSRVLLLCARYGELLFVGGEGVLDEEGERLFAHRLSLESSRAVQAVTQAVSEAPGLWGGIPGPAGLSLLCSAWRHRSATAPPAFGANANSSPPPLPYSVEGGRAAEVARELEWEWGWEDTAPGGGVRAPAPCSPDFEGRFGGLGAFYRPWRPVRVTAGEPWVDAAGAPVAGVDGGPAPLALRPASPDATAPPKPSPSNSHPAPVTAARHPSAPQSRHSDRIVSLLTEAQGLLAAAVSGASPAPEGPASAASPAARATVAVEALPTPPAGAPAPPAATAVHPSEEHSAAAGVACLLIPLVTSCLRQVSSARTRVTAIALLARLSSLCSCDETRLQRVVPYLVTLLSDPSAPVRAHALCALAHATASVAAFPPSDAAIFSGYVLPHVQRMAGEPEPLVQLAVAEALPTLALTARRFIDTAQWRAQVGALERAVAATAAAAAAAATQANAAAGAGSTSSAAAAAAASTRALPTAAAVPAAPSAGATAPSPPAPGAGVDGLKLRASYDYDLAALHGRLQTLLQRWLFAAGSQSGSSVASSSFAATLRDVLSSPAALAAAPRPMGSLGLGAVPPGTTATALVFDGAVLRQFSETLAAFPSSLDTSLPRRLLLSRAVDFCGFFGRKETDEFMLPLLLTLLQEPVASSAITTTGSGLLARLLCGLQGRPVPPSLVGLVLGWVNKSQVGVVDWMLRYTFVRKLAELAPHVGPYNTQFSLLPFIEQSVNDAHDPVVYAALCALGELALGRLVTAAVAAAHVARFVPLALHPSQWVRGGAARLLASVWLSVGWPRALTQTSPAVNPLLPPAAGELMWRWVERELRASPPPHSRHSSAPGPVAVALARLEGCFLAACLPGFTRRQWALEVHRVALAALAAAEPSLQLAAAAAGRRAGAAGRGRRGGGEAPSDFSPSSVLSTSLSRMIIAPAGREAASGGEDDGDAFSDAEADDEEEGAAAAASSLPAPPQAPPPPPPGEQHALAQRGSAASDGVDALLAAFARPDGAVGRSPASLPGPPPVQTNPRPPAHPSPPLEPSRFDAVTPYAPPTMPPATRLAYVRARLATYLAAVAGGNCLSPQICARLAAHNGDDPPASPAPTGPSSDPMVPLLPASSLLPYTEEELGAVAVRSLAIPDSRYASVHPQPPRSVVPRCPNPQDEAADALGGNTTGGGGGGVRSPDNASAAAVVSHPRRSPGYSLRESVSAEYEPESSLLLTRVLQAFRSPAGGAGGVGKHARVASAPLPQDLLHYLRLVRLRAQGQDGSGRAMVPSGLEARRQPPHDRLLPLPPSLRPLWAAGALSLLPPAPQPPDAAAASHGRPGHHRHRTLAPRPLLPAPLSAPPAFASSLVHLRRQHALWRRAGRAARRALLRHGLWDVSMPTDASAASQAATSGVGLATAFFYGAGARAHDDPSLLSSEDEAGPAPQARVTPQPLGSATPTATAGESEAAYFARLHGVGARPGSSPGPGATGWEGGPGTPRISGDPQLGGGRLLAGARTQGGAEDASPFAGLLAAEGAGAAVGEAPDSGAAPFMLDPGHPSGQPPNDGGGLQQPPLAAALGGDPDSYYYFNSEGGPGEGGEGDPGGDEPDLTAAAAPPAGGRVLGIGAGVSDPRVTVGVTASRYIGAASAAIIASGAFAQLGRGASLLTLGSGAAAAVAAPGPVGPGTRGDGFVPGAASSGALALRYAAARGAGASGGGRGGEGGDPAPWNGPRPRDAGPRLSFRGEGADNFGGTGTTQQPPAPASGAGAGGKPAGPSSALPSSGPSGGAAFAPSAALRNPVMDGSFISTLTGAEAVVQRLGAHRFAPGYNTSSSGGTSGAPASTRASRTPLHSSGALPLQLGAPPQGGGAPTPSPRTAPGGPQPLNGSVTIISQYSSSADPQSSSAAATAAASSLVLAQQQQQQQGPPRLDSVSSAPRAGSVAPSPLPPSSGASFSLGTPRVGAPPPAPQSARRLTRGTFDPSSVASSVVSSKHAPSSGSSQRAIIGGPAAHAPSSSGASVVSQSSSSRGDGAPGAAGGAFGRDNRDFLSPDTAESLRRRLHALDVPPLPPDLGCLHKQQSDPPPSIFAHAARVAAGVAQPDGLSSAWVGVGDGSIGAALTFGAPQPGAPGFGPLGAILDEAPRPEGSSEPLGTLGASPPIPAGGAGPSDAAGGGCFPACGFITPAGAESIRSLLAEYDVVEYGPGSGAQGDAAAAVAAAAASAGGGACTLPVVPVPFPVPLSEDLVRPGDVGDGTGYFGSGKASFAGVERGWHDGVGITPPFGVPHPVAAMQPLPEEVPALPAAVGEGWEGGLLLGGSGGDETGAAAAAQQRLLQRAAAATPQAPARDPGSGAAEGGITGAPGSASPGVPGGGPGAREGGGTMSWDGGDGTWGSRPRGILLLTGAEHHGAVNALAACGDHSFLASASDDGTVKVWTTRGLDREPTLASLLTYTGHLQEARAGDPLRGVGGGGAPAYRPNRVLDAIVCDNSTSVASGSAAGTVHVFRVDLPGATRAASKGPGPHSYNASSAPAPGVPDYLTSLVGSPEGGEEGQGGTLRRPSSASVGSSAATTAWRKGTHGSFVTQQRPQYSGRPSGGAGSSGRASASVPYGAGAPEHDDPDRGAAEDAEEAAAVARAEARFARCNVRTPDGVALVRRLVYDASEGGVVALRHYDSATQSVLAVAMEGGVLHGCDLRARREAWAVRLPPCFGRVTAFEVCPGSSSMMVGTDRGVIAVYDTRFDLVTVAWRHSAHSPISALYPYVTVAVRQQGAQHQPRPTPLLPTQGGPAPPLQLSLARQLAAGVATGENETSFWNLETGACTRLLRALPGSVSSSDARRLPFLTRIRLLNGRVAPGDAADLAPRGRELWSAARELTATHAHPLRVRSILCPLPTSQGATALVGLQRLAAASAGESDVASARAYAEFLLNSVGGVLPGGGEGGAGAVSPGPMSRTRGAGGDLGGGALAAAAAASGGLGFALGGMRGVGAVRRRTGFAVGYALQGATAATAATGEGGGGQGWAGGGGAPGPSAAFTYGGTPQEGLPVWILTAGSDRVVRCWDLDRPRGSHTVLGLDPGVTRDGYDGGWLGAYPRQPWQSAGDEPGDVEAEEEEQARGDRATGQEAGPGGQQEDGEEGDMEAGEWASAEGAHPAAPVHFLARHGSDGMGRTTCGSSAPIPGPPHPFHQRTTRRLRDRLRYPYGYQYPHPVRAAFAQPLFDVSAEADVLGSGGVPPLPVRMLKGPAPPPTAHDAAITCMAWLDVPTRLLLTGSQDGLLRVWR